MNLNSHKISLIPSNKAYLNNSLALARTNKLNKSRSILKNSVLRCALKENNIELARALAGKESELSEMRKENIRLTKDNYDLSHTGQFRTYNYNAYMTKFTELSDVALTLFSSVCKLSDELVEMKNHPFLTGDYSNIEIGNTTCESRVPSPFTTKNKIPRSPLKSFDEVNDSNPDTLSVLTAQIAKVKNQSNNSIHNLSLNLEANKSRIVNNKPDNKNQLDSSQQRIDHNDKLDSPKTSANAKSVFTVRRRLPKKNDDDEKPLKRRKLGSENSDPMFSVKTTSKSNQRKKKKLTLKTEVKVLNREEYKKHKETDAYHLSINETLNTTILPPSLNEFKNQQKVADVVESGKETGHVEMAEKCDTNVHSKEAVISEDKNGTENDTSVSEADQIKSIPSTKLDKIHKKSEASTKLSKKIKATKKVEVVMPTEDKPIENVIEHDTRSSKSNEKMINYFDDDDDDFILPIKDKTTKKNILDDSLIINNIDVPDNVKQDDNNKENEIKDVIIKPKTAGRSRKKVIEVVADDESIDELIVEKKTRKRKPKIDKVEKVTNKKSNISIIIADITSNTDIRPVKKETVKGRNKKRKDSVE